MVRKYGALRTLEHKIKEGKNGTNSDNMNHTNLGQHEQYKIYESDNAIYESEYQGR